MRAGIDLMYPDPVEGVGENKKRLLQRGLLSS